MLKLLDLFSGIGGFSLGMETTKQIRTIGFVEKDKFCQKVLRKNFKNVPIEEDIRNVKGSNYTADIISGGFPCQPFSVAGKRKGTEDDRYLWDEMLRVITEVKPRWVIGENVQGIININNGLVLRQVQTDLEAQGFQVQCFIIPASGIGAWHQRNRVWIVANSDKFRCTQHNETKKEKFEWRSKTSFMSSSSQDVPNSNSFGHRRWSSEGCANERWSFLPREQEGREMGSETSRCDVDVSNANNKRLQRYQLQSDNLQTKNKSTINSNSNFERQQTWWQTQSNFCGVPNGISYELDKDRANRIKALGNAIVPQIAYEIGQAILKAEYE